MIIQCNSCEKKFVVPNDAVTAKGRVVQCGACGNKWTQFPITNTNTKTKNTLKERSTKQSKLSKRKNKASTPSQKYTSQYLENKYGIKIDSSSDSNKVYSQKKLSTGLGFYGYCILLITLILTSFGILGLVKEDLIYNYPSSAIYIENIYEIVENIFIIFRNLI